MSGEQARLAEAAQAFVDAHVAMAKARQQLAVVMSALNINEVVAGDHLLTRGHAGSIHTQRIVNALDEVTA